MAFDYMKHPQKVNLGCGTDKKPGYLNIDLNRAHEPDLACDVSDLRALPSGYYSSLLAMDILEHIPRLKARNTLREWNRVLKTGGRLELQVPNILGLFSLMQKRGNKTAEAHERLLQSLFGTQADPGDFHYNGFTELYIRALLAETGFEVETLETRDGWLFHIVARKNRDSPVEEIFLLSDEDFISRVYRDYLHRPPDAEGYAYYLNLIKTGIAREAVVEAIKQSDEYHPGP